MELTQSIQHLLNSVSEINRKYEEIARIAGENFNIFSILKLQSDEVRLHSRLLGELLNPYGSHEKNELFLELFLTTIGLIKDYSKEQLRKATVIVEENIGNISDDYSKGGRIDLVIKFPEHKREIVIENKIYADDQPNQLGRYYHEYPNAHLIYLTPLERKPKPESIGNKLNPEYIKCITYKIEIKNWLELCHEKSSNFPMLREILNQYLYTIKNITNQSMNENMSNEIINRIVSNPESIKAANVVFDNWEKSCFKIIDNLKPEFEKIANSLDMQFQIEIPNGNVFGNADTGFSFYKKEWNYSICFWFDNRFKPLLVGIDNVDNKCEIETIISIKNSLVELDLPSLNYSNWIWVANFSDWNNCEWDQVQTTIPGKVKEVTQKILQKLEGLDPKS
jgi:hypothetical protein